MGALCTISCSPYERSLIALLDSIPQDSPAHLALLRVLELHPEYSQRQLAAAMGVSVGKTNYVLRALLDRGWVKAKNFQRSNNKLGYLYVLTPQGALQRLALTHAFLARKEQEYVMLHAQIADLRHELATQSHQPSEHP